MKLFKRDSLIYFEDGGLKFYVSQNNIDISESPTGSNIADITLRRINGIVKKTKAVSEILNFRDVVYGTTVEDLVFAIFDGQDVNEQDQTTDIVIAKFNQVQESTTLSANAAIDDQTITLTSATGTADGKYIILFHPASERFTTFTQIGAAAGSVITLDSPLDFDYPSGTFVDITDTNLGVNGSITTQVFGLRGTGAPPGVDIAFDLIRIIFNCVTASAVDLSKFADIATGITNGLVLRTRNNRHHNIFNVKTNADLAGILYDFQVYDAQNLQQGQHGFVARMTFKRMGVAIRLPIGDDAEFLIQDNLSSITRLEITAEGHITEEP